MNYMRLGGAVLVAALALMGLTACEEEPEQSAYCVQETPDGQKVVDEDLCNRDSHAGYMLLMIPSGHYYGHGSVIPHKTVTSGKLIRPSDTRARANAGLPKSGPVRNGQAPKVNNPPNNGGGYKPAPARPAPRMGK